MSMSGLMANPAHSTIVGIWYFGMGQPCQILLIDFSKTCVWYFRMGRPASINFSLLFSCEVNIGSDIWIAEMHNHRLFWMFSWIARPVCLIAMYMNAKKLHKLFVLILFLFTSHIVKVHTFFYKIGQSRDTLTADKTCMQTKKDRREYMWTAANEVITLGIMLVRIVLHVHPMPVIQEFKLIESIHSYTVRFHVNMSDFITFHTFFN